MRVRIGRAGEVLVTIERSHGKARPTLPRSGELRPVEAGEKPTEGRDAGGHFAAGNRHGLGARWKATIRRIIGRGATSEQADSVARQAFRLYCALLRELPSDGPSVRTLAALEARHPALAAFETDRAAELGFETEAGQAALERATKHGQRAERLAVTALDVSTRLRAARPRDPVADLERRLARFTPATTDDDEPEPVETTDETSGSESASTGQPEPAADDEGSASS